MTRPFLVLAGFSAVMLVGFGCFLLLGAAFCAATLHVPKRKGPPPAGASRVEIQANDGATLVGWWFSCHSPNRRESHGRAVSGTPLTSTKWHVDL